MTSFIIEYLRQVKEREDAATPEPWIKDDECDEEKLKVFILMKGMSEDDDTFIAHARTDLPRLRRALEVAMKQRNFYASGHGIYSDTLKRFTKERLEEDDAEIESILRSEDGREGE